MKAFLTPAARFILLAGLLICLVSTSGAWARSVALNGFTIVVDDATGGILSISHPSAGKVLETTSESAGLIDVAYPIHEFGPLRLATRFSKAKLVQNKDELVIIWNGLGPSRQDYALPAGTVDVQAKLKAAPNGRSIIFTCRIDNRSEAPVPQIMFPDVHGIRPFAGPSKTALTIAGVASYPFSRLVRDPRTSSFYGKGMGWAIHDPPGGNKDGLGRVYLAGPDGGISFFQKPGKHPSNRIFTHRKEVSPDSMRLMWEHQDSVAPGQSWESDEYWMTPFEGSLSGGAADLQKLSLNGLDISVDGSTGNLLQLSHPATGLLLDCESWLAGLLAVGSAKEKTEPLDEASSQYAQARVEARDGGFDITWDSLQPAVPPDSGSAGSIPAKVSVRPAPDKRSVILSCEVRNRTQTYIRLVRFPDFHGLKPLGDPAETRVQLTRNSYAPFTEKPGEWADKPNPLSWFDYGTYKSGISMFQRKWNRGFLEYRPTVASFCSEADAASVRLAAAHRVLIRPGETWQSGELWLTPHEGGWAKGIEVFREFVAGQAAKPPVPKRVAEELGFRTVFMTQPAETTTERAAFTFKDLPRIAQDAKEHGLHEVVPWFWCPYFDLPVTVRKELGTEEEFIAGVRAAKEMGVNIAPFISVNIIVSEHAGKYGAVKGEADWTYHTEAIPSFRPYYTKHQTGMRLGGGTAVIDPVWLQDVEKTLLDWINKGVSSFCWDLWYSHPELLEMIGRVRKAAKAKDPESSFAGEEHSWEQDGEVLDYTWRWAQYYDSSALASALPYPRFNCNVEASPLVTKMAFCDGIHINVMPKKPDQPNGTALISDRPELSAALKQCAKLRKQFLDYFLKGTLLGDSVLYEPASLFVRGHQLGNKLLIFALNNVESEQSGKIVSKLDLWLPKAARYQVTRYDGDGNVTDTKPHEGHMLTLETGRLSPNEFAVFEVSVQPLPKEK